ncbi:hypothetical protein JOD82_002041 [Paenibacillus sp. 1182]|nr:hypothetical protein [Paenibacillus sp. 1182]MBP1309021.1 hypothetical protein [Paenibacillus sp. 1182]
MKTNEVIICGECSCYVDGKCLKTGTIDVEPEKIGSNTVACEEFEETD